MNRFLLALALCLVSIALAKAQNLEDEVEFNYIKAKYLLDTERYEDAITAFTKIINENKNYKDALLLRAKSKYAMAAYTGTKKDVLLYAASNGMNGLGLTLLGKADYKNGYKDAALSSLSIAVLVNKEDAQVAEFLGNIYEEKEQLIKACECWQISAKMGSSKAGIKVRNQCGGMVEEEKETRNDSRHSRVENPDFPRENQRDEDPDDEEVVLKDGDEPKTSERTDGTLNNPTRDRVLKDNSTQDPDSGQEEAQTEDPDDSGNTGGLDETNDDDAVFEEADPVVETPYENLPPEDYTPNEIKIDDDLTLIIRGQGLGKRRILDQPNILILSDEDGIVAVDICVNRRGKVETAEFNSKLSTIAKKSLVSLAIRKSKDFWFEKNDYSEQCGVIMFKISAG